MPVIAPGWHPLLRDRQLYLPSTLHVNLGCTNLDRFRYSRYHPNRTYSKRDRGPLHCSSIIYGTSATTDAESPGIAMSLRINTNVPPVFGRINRSTTSGDYHNSASRAHSSPRTSPFRCKQTPHGSRKAHTFACLTNAELHLASPTWQLANQNACGESPQHPPLLQQD